MAKRGNGKLYIYNSDNTLKGYYELGSVNALPSEIENQEILVFNYFNNENCSQLTKINMKLGIPNNIFVLCKNKQGDLHRFEQK